MSTEQRHLDSRPTLAGGAGDDLELDRVGMPAGTVSTADTPRRFLRDAIGGKDAPGRR